ncbi:MAG: NHLP bacteriocin system secretion protein [Methylocystaceae bacterium]|nr:NHLP bacteriocin system secretion protein [Methylocystaceae bacterium]
MAEAPKRQIFRQAALDRLSSPEQLDRLIPVSDPLGWLVLTTLLTLLLAIVVWSILGKIPEQVEGKGILVNANGRVLDAMSLSEGTVSKLMVRQNDYVEKGQEIVQIEQSALHQELKSASETLKEREAEKRQTQAIFTKEFNLKQANFNEQAAAQRQIAKAAGERVTYLKSTLAKRDALAAKGFLPRDKVEEIRTEYNQALQDISAANNRILELQSESLTLKSSHAKEMTQLDQRIAETARRIREITSQLDMNGRILAPASGRITELKVFEGKVVQASEPLVSIATAGDALQAVLYIPTKDGKRITPGMSVRIAPSTVKKEEHGTIIGKILKVSAFPATKQGMLSVLQNEELVAEYSKDGAPYVARVDLVLNRTTSSGFKWTSGTGPNISISAGTTLEAEVTVVEQAPINLIIPFVRKHTGIGFLSEIGAR